MCSQDASEKCRELAICSVLRLVERVPDCVHALLPYVFPTLMERYVPGTGLCPPACRLLHARRARPPRLRQCHNSRAETLCRLGFNEASCLHVEPSEELRTLLQKLLTQLIRRAVAA